MTILIMTLRFHFPLLSLLMAPISLLIAYRRLEKFHSFHNFELLFALILIAWIGIVVGLHNQSSLLLKIQMQSSVVLMSRPLRESNKAPVHSAEKRRQRVLERVRCHLQSTRSAIFSRIRNSNAGIENMVHEEAQRMHVDMERDSNSCHDDDHEDDFVHDDVDTLIAIEEEIRREYAEYEASLLEEYERTLVFEESSLRADMDVVDVEQSNGKQLICPVCCQHALLSTGQSFICRCGVRIDTGTDYARPEFLHARLTEQVDAHADRGCCAKPRFFVQQLGEYQFLCMHCGSCGTYIVIT
jgi:hypothetical protein